MVIFRTTKYLMMSPLSTVCVWINGHSEHPVIRPGRVGAAGSRLKVINRNLLSLVTKKQGRGGWFDPSCNAVFMFQNGKIKHDAF